MSLTPGQSPPATKGRHLSTRRRHRGSGSAAAASVRPAVNLDSLTYYPPTESTFQGSRSQLYARPPAAPPRPQDEDQAREAARVLMSLSCAYAGDGASSSTSSSAGSWKSS